MIYNMMITEYLRKSVRIEADDLAEACEKVQDLLAEEKIVLGADDFQDRDIEDIDTFNFNNHIVRTHDTNNENYEVNLDFTKEEE